MLLAEDDVEIKQFCSLILPQKRPRSFLEFCHSMKLPDGEHAGEQLRPETEPAQMHFARAVDSGKYRRFVFVAPSQRGKTTIAILATWLYSIVEEGLDFGYIVPLLQKLDQLWVGKLAPGVRGSGFGSWIPSAGPGSKGGRPHALPMMNPENGKIITSYFMAAGLGTRETALSAVSPARLGIDEADDFADAAQIELALKRLESWGKKGRAFIASTVNTRINRDNHPILDFFNRPDATRSRLAHKCPYCNWYQIIKFDQLNLEAGQLACSHCGVLWNDVDRSLALDNSEIAHGEESVQNGNIVNPNKKYEYFSLLSSFADYHMGDFHAIPATYKAAKDKEKLGQYALAETFYQKVLCEPYTIPADHESITDRMLTLRSAMAKHEKGIVPDDADRIVVGVDVQGDRCYWVAVASGSRDRRWLIDWDEWFWAAKDANTGRPIEPTDEDRHAVLDRIIFKARDGWPREDGTVLKASLVAIDIGFNPNGSIGRFCFGKAGIVAVRGDHEGRVVAETLQGKVNANNGKFNSILVADHGLYEVRKQEAQPGQPGNWWFIKSQSMREHVSARLRIGYDKDGSMMLPHGIAEKDYLIQHLSSWVIVRDGDSKLVRWVQVRKRDDYADATNYATALLSQQPRRTPKGGVVGKIS